MAPLHLDERLDGVNDRMVVDQFVMRRTEQDEIRVSVDVDRTRSISARAEWLLREMCASSPITEVPPPPGTSWMRSCSQSGNAHLFFARPHSIFLVWTVIAIHNTLSYQHRVAAGSRPPTRPPEAYG
jgi:hypothetical protein